jgi:DNA (cytosine-5)-methyltransferase 1
MKLGGLFSGVGGFELAWTQLGHEVAWMCEWDKNARKVLEERFPGVPIYPDVRDLDPAEVEAVDVLTGGSPCQGFSIAGTRSGLEHSESQLFADYVRVMNGLAERGLRYAIWENVPGVLSIRNDDGERTFAHVVGALAGGSAAVRLDASRKWNAGLVANGRRAVSWRVLDSRYFGVAQRRRRVFACVAFGDSAADRAGRTLLAVAEGVRGDSASSQSEGEGVAGVVAAGVGGASVAYGMIGGSGQEAATVEEQPSITASHGQPGNVAQAFNWMSGGDCRGLDLTAETSGLTTQQTPAVLLTMRAGKPGGRKNPLLAEEQSLTSATGNGQTLFQPEPWAFSAGNSARARSMGEAQGIAPPVRAGDSGSVRSPTIAGADYGVRRLTPVECERLQSFPDGWTEPAGSDSARYKAMGNAVTVNVVRWILERMVNQ